MNLHYELYRRASLGIMLTDALDELIQSGHISPQLAMQVIKKFDKSMSEALTTRVKQKSTIRGNMRTYRYCDDVWTFIMKNPTIKVAQGDITVDRLRIIACNAKATSE
ncbi:Transcription initiation factor IIA subunit 2 [Coemansia sp. RSA 921]|nr:Transcription initiation factor IIA subunit 2 [Coemansia sp. RSA 921]KAJ2156937.1 Transcription initiation factor IIA subunit 2 [Coemansia sp. RSA 562]